MGGGREGRGEGPGTSSPLRQPGLGSGGGKRAGRGCYARIRGEGALHLSLTGGLSLRKSLLLGIKSQA